MLGAEGKTMKMGIIGVGSVGSAIAMAAASRARVREIVLVDRTRARSKAVATDMHYGAALSPLVSIRDGDYADLADAGLAIITAGINEKAGGATDRNDPAGRLRLLDANVKVFQDIVPKLVKAAPEAVIVVATDPPEPLADVARQLAGHDRIVDAGTYLDSLRFRLHIGERLGVGPDSVEANVVGEHGTSSVFLWSSARVGGMPVRELAARRKIEFDAFRKDVEHHPGVEDLADFRNPDAVGQNQGRVPPSGRRCLASGGSGAGGPGRATRRTPATGTPLVIDMDTVRNARLSGSGTRISPLASSAFSTAILA